jgi:hypothetical protein
MICSSPQSLITVVRAEGDEQNHVAEVWSYKHGQTCPTHPLSEVLDDAKGREVAQWNDFT